jgi:hypothetical protein
MSARHANGTHPSYNNTSSMSTQLYSYIGESLSPEKRKVPLKVLFLSADTGGGHRASAEALAKQVSQDIAIHRTYIFFLLSHLILRFCTIVSTPLPW